MRNKFIFIILFSHLVYANEKYYEFYHTESYILKCYQTAEKGYFGWKDTFDKKAIEVVQNIQQKNNLKKITIAIDNQKYILSRPADNTSDGDFISNNAKVYNIDTTYQTPDHFSYIKKFTIKTEKFIRQYECLFDSEIKEKEPTRLHRILLKETQ